MIITVASYKGGVGKTTSAVHLAAYLSKAAHTVLIDGDANRSASVWAGNGTGLPFSVQDERRLAKAAREFEHVVIDTQARPAEDDLRELVDGCDLLVIPSTPDALSLDALMKTVEALENLNSDRYRVLLTIIPPSPSKDGEEARGTLQGTGVPVFGRGIRRFAAFGKAALAGCLVYQVTGDPRAALGWEDYEAVGKEIACGQVRSTGQAS